MNLPKKISIFIIKIYQTLISPDHSWLKARYPYGYCRHYPSCSEYTKSAIEKFGLIKGVFLGTRRIIRCNPFASPSIDPVPKS